MWRYVNQTELYHYGIPGMKWGVRKAAKMYANYRITKYGIDYAKNKLSNIRNSNNKNSTNKLAITKNDRATKIAKAKKNMLRLARL